MKNINITDLNNEVSEEIKLTNWYVPFKEKLKLVDYIVNKNAELIDGLYEIDRNVVYMALFILRLPLYMNIVVDDVTFETYDLAKSNGLNDLIPDDELIEWDLLMKRSIENIDSRNSGKHLFGRFLENISNRAIKSFDYVDEFLDKGDPNKIAKYLSKGLVALSKQYNFKNEIDEELKE